MSKPYPVLHALRSAVEGGAWTIYSDGSDDSPTGTNAGKWAAELEAISFKFAQRGIVHHDLVTGERWFKQAATPNEEGFLCLCDWPPAAGDADPDVLPRLTSRLRGIAWRLEGIMQDPKLDEESTMLAKKALALTMDALKEASENDR